MQHFTTTPFGQRPVSAALISRMETARRRPEVPHVDKWSLFRDLCTARAAFGVSDRDLTVLNALLTFHPDSNLSDNANLIVFPSNAALSDRAHGMAESTLRRHLAALVDAGLILRHDSPNGKRYARRGPDGEIARAFGFDLRPLLTQASDIVQAAEDERAAQAELNLARETVSLLRRDALKLAIFGQESGVQAEWETVLSDLLGIHKALRRRNTLAELATLEADLSTILGTIHRMLATETEKMSGNDVSSERHYHNSNKDSSESELPHEMEKGEGGCTETPSVVHPERPEPSLPLAIVLKACPDILPYCDAPPRNWRDLVTAAGFVRGMMGISPSAWEEAQNLMGHEVAAVTVACILQRFASIHSPGGYLRALSGKAASGAFSPGPMVMALLNGPTRPVS